MFARKEFPGTSKSRLYFISNQKCTITAAKFTGSRKKMGQFVAPRWMMWLAWPVAVVIAVLNAWLLVQVVRGWLT